MTFTTWAATAALTTALIAAPTAAFAVPTTPSNPDCNFGQRVVEVWRQLPDELQADLKALRGLDQSARRDAAIAIREKALDGEYGDGVQNKAEFLKDRRALALETMPIELKHALLDLRNAAPGDRRELAQQIAEDALAGTYGPNAQETVERIQASDLWQACMAD